VYLSGGLWPRYLRGDATPKGGRAGHTFSLVARLDGIYPGTAEVFHHPVWELFGFDRQLAPKRLRELYMCMGTQVWMPFVEVPIDDEKTLLLDAGPFPFWKIHGSDAALQSKWSQIPGLDGVAVCLIEARMGYLGQNEATFANAILGAYLRLAKLSGDSAFQFSKQQSALLLLRAMCLHLVAYLVIVRGGRTPEDEIVRMIRFRDKEWQKEKDSHLKSLSQPARSAFQKWSDQVLTHEHDW